MDLNVAADKNAWAMLLSDWQNVAAFIAADPDHATASIRLPAATFPFPGDEIAIFSSPGPSPSFGGQYLLKHDIAATGVDVLTAPGGEDGLRLARERRPRAILLDVQMPGLNGWSVLESLKAAGFSMPGL